jgi:hypothetical protein
MLKEAIALLNAQGFIDGNSLPDSAPGHTYHYRSCSPNILVPASSTKGDILNLLKENGYSTTFKSGMIKISK